MIHLGWNSISNGFMNEIWEVGRAMTQKPYLSDEVSAVYAILNPDISLLTSNLYYLLTSKCIRYIYQSSQSSVLVVILNQAIHQRALNLYQQLISEKAVTILSVIAIQAFSSVIPFISSWTILLSSIQFWNYIEIHELCIPFNYSISVTHTFTYSIVRVRII